MKKSKQSFSSNKLAETRSKDLPELKKDLLEEKRQLLRLRLEIASGKIKNTKAVKVKRRDIAQLLTIIKEKEEQIKK